MVLMVVFVSSVFFCGIERKILRTDLCVRLANCVLFHALFQNYALLIQILALVAIRHRVHREKALICVFRRRFTAQRISLPECLLTALDQLIYECQSSLAITEWACVNSNTRCYMLCKCPIKIVPIN